MIEKVINGKKDEELDEHLLLKESPDSEYLRKTVFPLLYPVNIFFLKAKGTASP